MKQRKQQLFGKQMRRILSGLLCAVMLCSLVPVSLIGTAQAAEAGVAWTNEDLEKLNEYGIMRGDAGGMRPNDTILRSEFAAMINRALGYKDKSAKKLPFRDVTDSDWFADDISISYNMGFLNGTSKTTVSPYGTLTREEALVIVGRNLRLQPTVGESFSYADSRSFGNWSRGYIDPAIEAGIIGADRTGNFNPGKAITRGEVAGMVSRAIGTRIQQPGVSRLGTVDGNVTITASGVTLRNTTINGDLYLTGGISLGEVLLDNVTVNGKIIDSGAGLSEKGESSVILNNVSADALVVDSMRDQTISLRVKGNTDIPKTSVRSSAYIDDSTAASYGLELIEIAGKANTAVRLSGNIKEVHNKTPNSSLNIGEGVADKVTVDEAATGSTVTLGKDARVKELNLDAGIKVDGGGSIDKLSASADGASVAQYPDEIVVAPGITATVNKQKLDAAAAVEASSRPRLNSGYPLLDKLAPTSATGIYSTNKPGTVYWAVTAKADGSPDEKGLVTPTAKVLKSGKIQVKESNKELTAAISGLVADGDYYLSAMMEDSRGTRSTIKVTAFTTPDNTTPAFAKGYPAEHDISERDAEFEIMTTKSCDLYYAVLPKGSTAPRAIDFKAGSISGNLGYGVTKMEKNNPANIFVNDVPLEEQQSYVLYLWLNDFDGSKSSAVKAVNFTTQDRTNPIVSNLRQTDTKASTSVVSYSLSEQGTLYWAVVATGNETFMSPSSNTVTGVPFLETQEAKERVVSGVGALKKGTSAVAAAKAGSDIALTISGLNTKTTGTSAYDLYYVAQDKAGNWSDSVEKVIIYTLDTAAPTAKLKFTSFNEGEEETTKEPLADTDVKVVFSKAVRVVDKDSKGVSQEYPLLDLYQQNKTAELADALRKHVVLWKRPASGSATKARDEESDPIGYDINYSMARVYMDGTDMVVEFPYNANSTLSAHHLANGGEYYFELTGISDTTSNHNPMASTTLPFSTKQAQVNISSPGITDLGRDFTDTNGDPLQVDFSFQLDAKATSSSPEGTYYDVVLWCDESLTFDLYRREGASGTWQKLGTGSSGQGAFEYTIRTGSTDPVYRTVAGVQKSGNRYPYSELRDLKESVSYQYAVHIVTKGSSDTKRESWTIDCNIGASVVAGQYADLANLASGTSKSNWEKQLAGRVNSVGNPTGNSDENPLVKALGTTRVFARQVTVSASVAPVLGGIYPQFDPQDTTAKMNLLLDREGTIYYVVTPVTKNANGSFNNPVPATFVQSTSSDPSLSNVPESGRTVIHTKGAVEAGKTEPEKYLVLPDRNGIITANLKNDPDVRQDSASNNGKSVSTVELSGLKAGTWYYVYLMFESTSGQISEQAVCYRFQTAEAYTPQIALSTEGTSKQGTVKATVYKSSANVNARLIPISSLANTFFSHNFGGNTAGDSNLGFDSFLISGAPTSVQSLTVLEAMRRDSNGPSIFDVWASDDLKTYVADLIISGGSDSGTGSIATKTLAITMSDDNHDNSKVMEFPGLSSNSEYFCVAVASNTSDPSKQGFRAIRPVSTIDTTPPTVGSASGTLRIERKDTPAENGKGGETEFTLKGEVTINYRGYLYVKDGDTAVPFTQGGQVNFSQKGTAYAYPQQYFNEYFTLNGTDGTKKLVKSERTWAGVDSIIVGGSMYTIEPILKQIVPNMVQTVVITVNYPLGTYQYEAKQVDKTTTTPAVGTEGQPGYKPAETVTTTETQYFPPDFPLVKGEISIPTGFVSANGDNVDIVGKITYQNTKAGDANVSASYSAR